MSSKPCGHSPVRGRRGARRLAVQALYRWLIAGGEAPLLVSEFLADPHAKEIDRAYFEELLSTALNDATALDECLAPALDRAVGELDAVEHGILLLGVVELRDHPELAVSIVTNEAVELARTFGAEGGHRYVNGVLDKLALRLRPHEAKRGGG